MIEDARAVKTRQPQAKALCPCADCGDGNRRGELLFRLPSGDIICERCLEEGVLPFHRREAHENEILPVFAGLASMHKAMTTEEVSG